MLRPEFASESAGKGERLAARIVAKFLLRHCIALAQVGGGDLGRGFVLMAIVDANVRHLRHYSPKGRELGGSTSMPSDEDRKPISVSALARVLHMPYETTRRHVAGLIRDGACLRISERGVIVPTAWLAGRNDITVKMYDGLRTLLGMLQAAGFDLDGMARDSGRAEDAVAAVAAE